MVLRCSDMNVVHNEGIDLKSGLHSESFFKDFSQKHDEKTEVQLYVEYLLHPNNAHLIKSPWKRVPSGSVFYSTLWNKERHCEEVVLFTRICSFVYI